MRRAAAIALVPTLALAALGVARPQAPAVEHDLIYLKQGGAAFTMDAFRPAKPNGIAVVSLVSGGWFSDHKGIDAGLAKAFTDKGITCFEVVHGSQPRYKIPEIEAQIDRAIRYVRANAARFGVSPTKIGVFGGSAGGHLSLMSAVAGSEGRLDEADPVDKQPTRPNAIVALFPPTDFVNFLGPGKAPVNDPGYAIFRGAFPLKPDATPEETAAVAKSLSPIYGVTKDFPPTLLMHGDADKLVPLEQSRMLDAALTKAGVDHKLVVVPGAGHATPEFRQRIGEVVDWFLAKLGG